MGPMKIEAGCINSACLAKDFKTEEVVRLADMDKLLYEAVWAMEWLSRELSTYPHDRAKAFLDSPLVADWRTRQGKKEGYVLQPRWDRLVEWWPI